LTIALNDFTMESTVDVGISLGCVVVIAKPWRCMAVELIEALDLRPVWLGVSIDRIAIECISDRIVFANDPLKVRGGDVIVVIAASTTVTAELIQFTGQERVRSSIIL